jgi:diguanylate cyclase (GGDEF)-like protein
MARVLAGIGNESENRQFLLPTMRALLEAGTDGLALCDEEGRYLLYNDRAKKLLGLGGAVPHLLFRFDGTTPFPPEELPVARALLGEEIRGVELVVRDARNGSEILVHAAARPILDSEGGVIGAVCSFADVSDLKMSRDYLTMMATTDELTGLPNYRALRNRLADLCAEGARGRSFALVFADVDHFKLVNDRYGHAVGNEILAKIARVLRTQVRNTDLVARFGGEEFCVLFVDVDEARAIGLAERLRESVEALEFAERLTASFGVCEYSSRFSDVEALMRAADQALYRAKARGRNCVIGFHDP